MANLISFVLPTIWEEWWWSILKQVSVIMTFTYKYFFYWIQLLYNGVLVSSVQPSISAICIHMSPPSWTSLPPTCPSYFSRSSQNTELSSLWFFSRFPLAFCFTHGSVYMSILISHFIPFSPSPTVSTCPFSISASLFLHCR